VISFIESFFLTFSILASPAHAKTIVFFNEPLESRALNNFFGELRGNYFETGKPLSDQAKSGVEVDFTAEGHPISEMPYLGDGSYLDAGTGYFSIPNTEGTALILTPYGKVLAAGFYWTSCWDCGIQIGFHLTIFTRSTGDLTRTTSIFKHWAEKMESAELSLAHLKQASVDFSDAENWGNQNIKINIPMDVVTLKQP